MNETGPTLEESVARMTPEQKDKALVLAFKACRWFHRAPSNDLAILLEFLEQSSGTEIMRYL